MCYYDIEQNDKSPFPFAHLDFPFISSGIPSGVPFGMARNDEDHDDTRRGKAAETLLHMRPDEV